VELEGCVTQARSREALDGNMAEALNAYLDEPADSRVPLPMPMPVKARKGGKSAGGVAVAVEPRIAFAHWLRTRRLARGWTQKEAARQLGMKNLYSYQRLESGKTANPELLTLVRIKAVFPEIDLDDVVG
jgi:antitoxin HicB